MKQLISRRSFLKAAGVTTAVAAVSLGAPAASACYPGSFKDITICTPTMFILTSTKNRRN